MIKSLFIADRFGSRIYYQEFRRVRKFLDLLSIFHLEHSFESAEIAGFGNPFIIQLNGFDKVISEIHHKLHSDR